MNNEKIESRHQSLAAYVYVRQSTGHQVRHHHQGRERQYELAQRARELGFAKVVVVDEDQGKTGSGLVERPGFASLLAAVCAGEVGAVFALEASRLARNNVDWHHLIDLCAMTATLIIDGQGVYDPRQLDDRLLLGLKGTMSEFELSLFRQRAREAFERKIQAGHALWEMPVGLVRTEDDRVEKIADRQVQSAIAGVFRKFRELGSARQAGFWYRDQQILLPEAVPGSKGHQVVWREPKEQRIRQILKNPHYAGALAYGRTESQTEIKDGRVRKSSTRRRKPRDKWKLLILDNHVGYISWNEYLENLSLLESNLLMSQGSKKGAARSGPALLSGLLRCGHCGRKMFVAYGGKRGRTPRYVCNGGRDERGHSNCQSLGGARVDRAASEAVLEAIEPAGIEAALTALDQLEHQHQEKRTSMGLTLERAGYEVGRAQRQYDTVDPDNRLVAGELESRWNAALERVDELQQQLAQLDTSRKQVTQEEKQRLLELGRDLPALWNHPSAADDLKKRILRTVLEEIIIQDNADRTFHVLYLHWKGGTHTELQVRRNTTGKKPNDTDKTALELIEELSKVCSDQAITALLNRLGYKTGAGKTWRVHSVHNARYIHRLTNYRRPNEWVTVQQAAIELQVSQTVIRRLIREQKLPASQLVETTPWIISRDSLSLPAVQAKIEAVHAGRQLPRHDPNQQEFPFK